MSLGRYVILGSKYTSDDVNHEIGHTFQSRYLGPLYLIIIGLPSILGNIYDRCFHTEKRGWSWNRSAKWYYNLPWEKWADKLGGVKRV